MTGYQSKKTAARDKLVQDAFNDWWGSDYDDSTNPCIEGTPVYWAWAGWHAALAQSAQEPVATLFGSLPVYDTTPPQRPWVDLTDEEFDELEYRFARYELCRAIGAALRSKNT